MLSKISCSATKLSLLQPAMIRAIVEGSAFRVGKQYATEKRVRISRADEVEIVSLVMGNAGPLEQTIQLKEGSLMSQCTCQLNERPLCRHCIAVLLEYHRVGAPAVSKPASASASASRNPPSINEEEALVSNEPDLPPAREIKFSDIAVFVDWLHPAFAAIHRGEPLPESPMLGHGPVDEWVRTIHALEEGHRQSDDAQKALRAECEDVQNRLQIAIDQASDARSAQEELQGQLVRRRQLDQRLSEVTQGIEQFRMEIKAITQDLANSGARLETLNGSFTEISKALDQISNATAE
jgi:hypothetical protein